MGAAACGSGTTQAQRTTASGRTEPSPSEASESPAAAATCEPNHATVHVRAKNFLFTTDCLAASAEEPFTVMFHNQDDGVTHNVSIASDAGERVLSGDPVVGVETVEYKVAALPAGMYTFQCDFHPATMTGTFVVA